MIVMVDEHSDSPHSAERDDVERVLRPMFDAGWDHHAHDHLKPGVRVRNRGEQYPEARQWGTSVIVAVLRKPGAWERTYGRLNIEVLVRRDRPSFGAALTWWADYGTYLVEGCWIHGDGRLTCAEHQREADHA